MRTIHQYFDWMKLCKQLDPDCTYLVSHSHREKRGITEEELEREGIPPLSEMEEKLYVKGPTGLLELDNSVLYVKGEKEQLEKLLEKAGFEVNEAILKRNFETGFDNAPAWCTRYDHKNGVVTLQFFYGMKKPLLRANIKDRKDTGLLSWLDLIEEVYSGEAEYLFDAAFILNHYGRKPFRPNQSGFEFEKAQEAGMRDNSLPLLEALVNEAILAILKPKGTYPVLLNLPQEK